jgi:hypothetical protein
MNNKTILSALHAQVETKTAEYNKIVDEQQTPQLRAKSDEVLTWLRENVSSLIPSITLDIDRLEINKTGRSNTWSAATVYINTDWKTEAKYAKLNWYSSSATLEDKNELNDVQVFGQLAAHLAKIEWMMINEWSPSLRYINASANALEKELDELKRSIRDIETKVAGEEKLAYSKIGFDLQFKKFKCTKYREPKDGVNVEGMDLVEYSKSLQLKTGRGRWDYVNVYGYKVLGCAKGKYIIQYNLDEDNVKKYQIVVTEKNMKAFIDDVYYWESVGCDTSTAQQMEKYNRYQNYLTSKA